MENYILLKIVVEEAISNFSELGKKIANLKFFEGYTNGLIAEKLNISSSCVSYHLDRARKVIGKELRGII
jgi:DNA-directed RNA polymerase specialized sigma subunit